MRMLSFKKEERDLAWLQEMLQFAIQLEFATIPPYLTAMWSVKATAASPAPHIILSVVLQEMLHMATACNLLTSIGGSPRIADSGTVPAFPGPLPGGVHPGLEVALRPLSQELLADTLMPIEEPDPGPVKFSLGQTYPTIGSFYNAIQDCIRALPPDIFTGQRQLSLTRAGFRLKSVHSQAEALEGLEMIKDQGEGNEGTPFYGPDPADLAHYFLFGQLYHGRALVQVAGASCWDYDGEPIDFPAPSEIYPMAPVPPGGYPEGAAFDAAFSEMLRELQGAWDTGGQEMTNGLSGQAGVANNSSSRSLVRAACSCCTQ